MRRLRAFLLRLAGSVAPERAQARDFADEIRSHLQMHIDDNVARGMTPDDARRDATLRLGGVRQAEEQYRDRRRLPSVDALQRDLRYAWRALLKAPGFSAAAIIVLALGIGANTAVFSVVNAVILRPLPYPDADRIVRVWHVPPQNIFHGQPTFSVSPANYLDWRARSDVFDRMAAYSGTRLNLTGNGEPDAIVAGVVSADFFEVMRAQARVGRTFRPEEEQPGRERVIVLSDRLWRTRFGGDPSIVGRSIRLDDEPYLVTGIMPAEFAFPVFAQAWMPIAWDDTERAVRGNHSYIVMARLKNGVSVQQAQGQLTAISTQLEAEYPEDNKGWGAVVIPLHADLVQDVRETLLVLLGAVGFVLLIACANLANLLLAKTLARGKEVAVRTALGASRGRIVQQIVCETMMLGTVGGVLGVLLAWSGIGVILGLLGPDFPRASEIAINRDVLAFAAFASLATGLAAGIIPAWRLTAANVNEALKQGLGRSASQTGERRTRTALVVAEVALASMLLIGAGLLIRSLWLLQRVDPGIDTSNVLTASLATPRTKYPNPAAQARFFDAVLERIRQLPGVETASGVDSLPLAGGGSTEPIAIEGRAAVAMSEQPEVAVRGIQPGYARAMRLRLVAGRDFSEADVIDRPPVVLVSQSMAQRFWPNESAIGKRLTLTFYPGVVREIVGVVGDVKLNGLDVVEPVATLYLPRKQVPTSFMSLVVKTTVPPTTIVPALTAAIHEIDADQPVLRVRTMEQIVGSSLSQERFSVMLLSAFSGLALLLAGVGIYGVLSYTVRQRVREIGIRMALGAPAADVRRMVVVEGLKPTIVGIAIGLLGAAALGRAMATLVFGISARDLTTFGVVSAVLAGVAVVASLVPAYRATRVDPTVALRCD